MKKILLLIACISMFSFLNAQTVNLGDPIGWNGKLESKDVPVSVMPGYNQTAIDAQDIIDDQAKNKPWRFGYKYAVNFNFNNSGVWSTLPNGDKIWQLAIECKNALTVNLLFKNYHLPQGASLYLYDVKQTNRVGAYTQRNNRADGELGTELVHGDKIIVEYFEPSAVAGQGAFTITNVIHGYRSLDPIQKDLAKALNSSGDCNIDVNCPLGNGWDNEIRSVAMIVVGGSGICTGALINNTCDDGTPYFLTANHCLGGGTGSWAFRFNWKSPSGTESCATSANSVDPGPPYDQTANGATTLVSGTAADHGLLQIDNMTVTDAENWNCFYAGWDATDNTTVTETTGIHHPSGDVMKICRDNDAPFHSNAAGAAVWYINQWEEGVTEPGSSGSPLFDQNHRIIGQLYGGAAACSGTNNNGQYDYYGRLGVSWTSGISTYLAPNSCGSATTNDGWDPNTPTLPDDAGVSSIASPVGAYCVDNFDPELTIKNFGTNTLSSVTINYDIDGGTNNTYSWSGSLAAGASVVVTLPTMITTSGPHTFNAYTSSPNGNTDSAPGNDGGSTNYTATIGGQDILLEINTDCWGSETTWTIEDASANVLASGGPYTDITGGELITENICIAVGCYDFTINDTYGDGMHGSQWGSCTVDGDYTITDVASGAVLATILAANSDFGNQEINNFCVTSPCSWTLSSSSTEELCNGDGTGSISISVNGATGPFTYDIGNGPQSSSTFSNLAQGTYSILVDDGSCSSSISVVLGGPDAVAATATISDISCNGLTDGAIVINPSGGVAPYSYNFGSGFVASGDVSGLGAGSITVSVQDANGCTGSVLCTVNEPAVLSATSSVTDETVGLDGAINVSASGGTPPFSYSWIGPAGFNSTNEDVSGLASGLYTVTITDANGCTTQLTDILVSSFVGISAYGAIDLSLYPNPSNGIFNVKLNALPSDKVSLSVVDIAGKLVVLKEYENTQLFSLDISDKANGTYLLKITIGDKSSQLRIVKSK
ncbi:MAG: T9SS type A sorting domain-containing protein [Parvicellaceae bacterium]